MNSEDKPTFRGVGGLTKRKSRIQELHNSEVRHGPSRNNSNVSKCSSPSGRRSVQRRGSVLQPRPQLARLISQMSKMQMTEGNRRRSSGLSSHRRPRLGSIIMGMTSRNTLKRQSTRFSLALEEINIREGFMV